MRLRLKGRYCLTLATLTLSVTLVLGGALFFQFQAFDRATRRSSDQAMESALLDQIEAQGRGLAEIIADSLIDPLYRFDLDTAEEVLGASLAQDDILAATVFDTEGKVLLDHSETYENYGRTSDDPAVTGALAERATRVEIKPDVIRVVAPITIGSKLLGVVNVDLSREASNADIAELRTTLGEIGGREMRSVVMVTLVITGSLIGVAIGLSLLVARGLSTPIGQLSQLTRRIGAGDYEIAPPFDRADEIGELGAALSAMAARLKHTTVSKDYVDNILASMMDPLLVLAADGTIATANEGAERLLGYAAVELVGLSIGRVLRHFGDRGEAFDPAAVIRQGGVSRP